MDHVIEVDDRFYILAGSSLVEQRTLVLKQGDAFAGFDALGDIDSRRQSSQGLFVEGMRHLSRLNLRLMRRHPLSLSSAVTRDNTHVAADCTNPDITEEDGRVRLPHGALHLARSKHLWGPGCYERLVLTNHHHETVEAEISIDFAADFADIFEVRGMARERRGRHREPVAEGGVITFAYDGLDGVTRRTRIECDPRPDEADTRSMTLRATLGPGERTDWRLTILCEPAASGAAGSFEQSSQGLEERVREMRSGFARVESTSQDLAAWLDRSRADMRMLLTPTPEGMYPYAGVPWYNCPFGRDGIITALQLLWVNPDVARGVLRYLAALQADAEDPVNDAEPGKILHERRTNEMAATGEVPFGRYYGTVDATPLFVVLAGAAVTATGDMALAETIWPNVERALAWIDRYGDEDGDGLIEYRARSAKGLANQGWKDSYDSVFHEDGALASGPIALCEVQGYVFQARRHAAALARVLGRPERARELDEAAEAIRRRFEEAFWLDDLGFYAIALDGDKAPCRVLTSNAGHALFSGICSRERAAIVARRLMGREFFCGWGIRTVAEGQPRYNPVSYHNGSVWPHDNAIIAAGFARYGFRRRAVRLFRAFFDATRFIPDQRLPELYCGFARSSGRGPTSYPVACSPQAWASGAVYMLLGACLGLRTEGLHGRVWVDRPALPSGIGKVRIRDLRVGSAKVDLLFDRSQRDVAVVVLDKRGAAEVMVTK